MQASVLNDPQTDSTARGLCQAVVNLLAPAVAAADAPAQVVLQSAILNKVRQLGDWAACLTVKAEALKAQGVQQPPDIAHCASTFTPFLGISSLQSTLRTPHADGCLMHMLAGS